MLTKTIDQLAPGDVVLAINGKPRPFPYTVTRVITNTVGKTTMTRLEYAHGGFTLPCDPTTAIATVAQ